MPWMFAANCSELAEGHVIAVTCGGERLALYKLPDGYFATSDTCPHQGGSLSEGCVVDDCIECPLHLALFDIRTGATDGGVTTTPVRTFNTRVDGGKLFVEMDG
jgi:3-phenylpropionate/trans-cinnamate dioxygenase ferredoxin component